MKRKMLLLIISGIFSISAFSINLFKGGARFQLDLLPWTTTTSENSDNIKSGLGFGVKAEGYAEQIGGLGIGFKTHSNSVVTSGSSNTNSLRTTTVPLYIFIKGQDNVMKDFPAFYVKGNLGYALAWQSGENSSNKVGGIYLGAFAGMDFENFYTEIGFERSGKASKSLSIGLGIDIRD